MFYTCVYIRIYIHIFWVVWFTSLWTNASCFRYVWIVQSPPPVKNLWLNPWPAPNATKLTETHGTHSNPQGPKAIPQAKRDGFSTTIKFWRKTIWYRSPSSDLSGCLVMVTLQVSRRPVSTALDFLKPIRVATHLQFVTLRPYTRWK